MDRQRPEEDLDEDTTVTTTTKSKKVSSKMTNGGFHLRHA